jgi:hypothetical protein
LTPNTCTLMLSPTRRISRNRRVKISI